MPPHPRCLHCTPGPCSHGEQAEDAESLELFALRAEVASLRVALEQTCRCRCHVEGSGVPPCGDCEKCAWGLDEEQAHVEELAIGFAIKAEREACARVAEAKSEQWSEVTSLRLGGVPVAAQSIAAAIRARSTKGETP